MLTATPRWGDGPESGARARIAAPAAMQLPLRVYRCALPRSAFAPGNSGFASRRLDDFGIARFWKWGGRRVLPPLGDLHRIECWLLHHGLRLKVILRPALPRHGPHYECGALLTSATEESEMVLPRGLAPRTSAFAERRAELLHLGS